MKIPCYIIEDDEPAVELLSVYINRHPALELAGYAHQNIELPQAVFNGGQLIFLDINTPFRDGLSFLRGHQVSLPVIITTSYCEFALEGFNLAVIDYLLKPFSEERFGQAVEKATDHFRLKEIAGEETACIWVKDNYQSVKIMATEIYCIEGWKQYNKIYTKTKTYMVIDSLKQMETALPGFIRCHKSWLVNRVYVDSFNQTSIRVAGKHIPVGRVYREVLARLNG